MNKLNEIKNELEELDPYYISYYIVNNALKYDNIYDGISKSLYLVKLYFKSKGVILYKLNENDNYENFVNPPFLNVNYQEITNLLNKDKNNIENNKRFKISTNNKELEKVTLLPITFNDSKYILAIINNQMKDSNQDKLFMNLLEKSFKIILEKMELYEKMHNLSNIDGLTHLDNRLSFSNKIKEYNDNNKHISFVILDLFRLKYINDNYGHIVGDLYIKCTANILKNYFPKFSEGKLDLSIRNETGDYIFRIGGDEFVIISENKTYDELKNILEKVVKEVSELNLGIGEEAITGINCGIEERKKGEPIEELYRKADEKLSDDKRKMYQKLNINRRK